MSDPPISNQKRYPILITEHARQRWIERAVDPKRYQHLSQCRRGCAICIQLIHDIRGVMRMMKREIDGSISRRALAAIQANERVNEPLFLEAIRKKWPEDALGKEHYMDRTGRNTIIFAISREPDGRPVVVTVLTWDMIDGTVLMANQGDKESLKRVFETWKREAKRNV